MLKPASASYSRPWRRRSAAVGLVLLARVLAVAVAVLLAVAVLPSIASAAVSEAL